MRELILSWLLHHANRYYKDEHFYKIKANILAKYGAVIDYHYQKIDGKKCHTCGGSGTWIGYSWYSGKYRDICNKCGGDGWYITPHWNVLAVVKMGRFTFHKPINRSYKKPETGSHVLDGYINHEKSQYSYLCRMILFMIYDFKGHGKNWRFNIGNGWRMNKQWKPVNIIYNLAHIIKYGRNAYPFMKYRMMKETHKVPKFVDHDDLPF